MNKIRDSETELKIALDQLLTSINNVVDGINTLVADKGSEYRVSYTMSLFELEGDLVLLKPKILNQLAQL